jgi:hypothetical protein
MPDCTLQKKCEDHGFPTIAELACEKDWAPLQNLCRRRVVKEEEANEKYRNKTAVQWARHNGEHGLAKELEYLLVRFSCEVIYCISIISPIHLSFPRTKKK